MSERTIRYAALIWELTKTDLKLRYAGSFLGFIWVFLKPFATFAILLLVFSAFFGQHDPFYSLNLLIGLVIFYYFSEGTSQLSEALLKRAHIILRLNFPRIIVIWSSLLSSLINFLASLLFFFVLIWFFYGSSYELSIRGLMFFVVSIIFLSLLITGFGLFASIIQVRFRDFQQIWTLILQLLLYSTPIIYPLAILPTGLKDIVLMNPLTIILDFARNQILGAPLSVSIVSVYAVAGLIIVLNIVGYQFFQYHAKKIAEKF